MTTADDVKARLARALACGIRAAQFEDLASRGQWAKAAAIVDATAAGKPRDRVVSLAARRVAHIHTVGRPVVNPQESKRRGTGVDPMEQEQIAPYSASALGSGVPGPGGLGDFLK